MHRLPLRLRAGLAARSLAAFVGSIGNWMQATAQGWLVLSLTDSNIALGATSAAATAPILILSILAGVLADRVDLRDDASGTRLGQTRCRRAIGRPDVDT